MRRRSIKRTVLLYVVIIAIVAVFNLPIINAVLTSFKSNIDISSSPPKWIFRPTLTQYNNVLFAYGYNFRLYFMNSVIISSMTSLVVLALGIPAAYGIARYRSRVNPLGLLLGLRLVPIFVFIIPVFILFTRMGLVDTRTSLVMMNTVISVPLGIFLLVGFIQEIPSSIDEAARIDGASVFTILTRIILPLSLPGIAAVVCLTFIFTWSEYLMSLILSFTRAVPITVGASFFITAWEVRWGEISAAITLSVVPVFIFVFFVQDYLVRAFTGGALKG